MNKGIEINAVKIKIPPAKKSIQLPKSFKKPIKDLAKSVAPKIINIKDGISDKILKVNIKPDDKSSVPKILTNMFFNTKYSLKIYPMPE